MNDAKPKKTIIRCRLDDLKPHPRQAKLFSDLPEPALQDLAEDIKQHGLKHPVEILPNKTIICGHQRVRALRLLSHNEVRCWVREDLKDAGEVEIEERMIYDNLLRRQMTEAEAICMYIQLKQLAQKSPRPAGTSLGDLRDRIAKQFGRSGRTLSRYERVWKRTPEGVREALFAGRLTLTLALKVADLAKNIRQEIAQRIQKGEDPRAVVKEYMSQDADRTNNFRRAFRQLVKAGQTFLQHFGRDEDFEELAGRVLGKDVNVLKQLEKRIRRMVKWLEKDQQRAMQEIAEVAEKCRQFARRPQTAATAT